MPRFGPYKFYNGEISLFFDSDEHVYVRQDGEEFTPVIGVTSALKIIDKSEYLLPWGCKRMGIKLKATMPKILMEDWEDYTKSIPWQEFEDLVDAAKKAHKEILQDAGDVGTAAHQTLEDSIKFAIQTNKGVVEKLINLPEDGRAVQCCNAAFDWMNQHKTRFLSTERKIYSREHDFAGTMDGTGIVSSCKDRVKCCPSPFTDRQSLIDWKSSNQLSVSYAYQVAAYWGAQVEELKSPITDACILRLGKEQGDFEPWHLSHEDLVADYETFLSFLTATRRHDATKKRISAANKERTARKRAAKKEAKA